MENVWREHISALFLFCNRVDNAVFDEDLKLRQRVGV